MEWIHPKTIIGSAAEDDKYLRRPELNKKFWLLIEKGEHVRFTAPRRVGKSSIMKDLAKNPAPNTIMISEDIESDTTSQQFYKRLCNLIIGRMKIHEAAWKKIMNWYKSRNIEEISIEGVFKIEKQEVDYKTELLELINYMEGQEYTVILFLDEFPDVLMSIKKESPEKAIEVLHTLRAIRQNQKEKKFRIVLAGSIGLEHVITDIDRKKLINDIPAIDIPPFTEEEAYQLLELLLKGVTIKMGAEERTYLLKLVKHLLPYYLQILITLCDEIAYKADDAVITIGIINQAYALAIANNGYFDDWETRLGTYLTPTDYNYCLGLLTRCAHSDYTLQQAYDYSKTTKPAKGYKALIDDVLVKDGYLVLDGINLKFLSPFLEAWWQNRHPKFEIED